MGKKKRPVVGGWGSFRASFSYSFFFPTHTFLPFVLPLSLSFAEHTDVREEEGNPQRVPSGLGGGGGKANRRTRSSGLWNNYIIYCYIHVYVLHRHRVKRNFLPSFLRLLFLLLITGWLVIVRYNMTLIDDSLLYKLPSIKNEWISEWPDATPP